MAAPPESPPASPGQGGSRASLSTNHYMVGWITALPHELAVAYAMLDDTHEPPEDFQQNSEDTNNYKWGNIGHHNIVIASLAAGCYGTVSTATTVTHLKSSLPHLRLGLMVGIGAGIPKVVDGVVDVACDIRLGDVAVSLPQGTSPGVVQYNLGRVKDGCFERVGSLDNTPVALLKGVATVKAHYEIYGSKIPTILRAMCTKYPRMAREYVYQGADEDVLFDASAAGDGKVIRPERPSTDPEVHYGVIASGDWVVKDAGERDKIVKRLRDGCICLEMEAAGLMNTFPCLVIRGICDYADAHKNDQWQRYAAATAGAFAKELLGLLEGKDVRRMQRLEEVVGKVYQKVSNITQDAHSRKLRKWLQAPNSSLNCSAAFSKRHAESGTWLLQSEQFRKWKSGSLMSLWLRGIPGCGKTILSSILIRHLELKEDNASPSPCLYFFFDFRDPQKQRLENLVRSLFQQLLDHKKDAAFENLTRLYEECGDGREQPTIDALKKRLQESLHKAITVDIVVDALDECTEHSKVIEFLEHLRTEFSTQIRVIITSRPLEPIQRKLSEWIFEEAWIVVGGVETQQDLRSFVGASLNGDDFRAWGGKIPLGWPEHELSPEDAVIDKANGMFQLATLQLEELKKCLTINAIKAALKSLPSSLFDMYNRMLSQIPKPHKSDTVQLLQFLVFSDSALTTTTAMDVMCVHPGCDPLFTPLNRLLDDNLLLALCPGLFEITEFGEIRFSHASVKDYLESLPGGHELENSLSKTVAQTTITKICMFYMSPMVQSKDTEDYTSFIRDDARHHLIFYSKRMWEKLARVTEVEQALQDDILAFIIQDSTRRELFPFGSEHGTRGFSWNSVPRHPLIVASQLGLAGTVSKIIEMDTGQTTISHPSRWEYGNALLEACRGEYSEVTRSLLEAGADPNASSGEPLVAACEEGNLAIVKLLLDRGADPCLQQGASFKAAAALGNAGIVKLILGLGKGSEINLESAISDAFDRDDAEIFELLTNGESEKSRQEHLDKACSSARFKIFKRLLVFEANPNLGHYVRLLWNVKEFDRDDERINILQLLLPSRVLLDSRLLTMAFGSYFTRGFRAKPSSTLTKMMANSGDDAPRLFMQEFHRHMKWMRIEDIEKAIREITGDEDLGELLNTACRDTNYKAASLLIDLGAPVDYDDGEPLRIACMARNVYMAGLLLKRGADPNAKSSNPHAPRGSLSPLQIAEENKHEAMRGLLERFSKRNADTLRS